MTKPNRYNVPDPGTTDWHLPLNENWERLANDVEVRAPEADLEEWPPNAGAGFFATDTETLYIGDGEQWTEVESSGRRPQFEAISGDVTNDVDLANIAGENLSIDANGNLNATAIGGSSGGYGTVVSSIAQAQEVVDNSQDPGDWSENTRGGDLIVLEAKTYTPNSEELPLRIDRPMSIVGAGRRQTVIEVPDGYAGNVLEVDRSGYGSVRFADFGITGDAGFDESERATDGQCAFYINRYAHNWRLDNVYVWGVDVGVQTDGDAEQNPGAWLGSITNSAFRYCNHGADFYGNTHGLRIHSSGFDHQRDYGIRLIDSSGVSIHQCHLEQKPGAVGIRADYANGLTIHGCYMESMDTLIELHPDQSRLSGNHRTTASIRGCNLNIRSNQTVARVGYVTHTTFENNVLGGGNFSGSVGFEWTTSFAESNTRYDWNRINSQTATRNSF